MEKIDNTHRTEVENKINAEVYGLSTLDINSTLVRDFCYVLKKYKIFGTFSHLFTFSNFLYTRDYQREFIFKGRNAPKQLEIGDLVVSCKGMSDSKLVTRLLLLREMMAINRIFANGNEFLFGDERKKVIKKAFLCYAREYFIRKNTLIKHSRIYYSILFGLIYVLIGLAALLGVVFYLFGSYGVSLVIGYFGFTFFFIARLLNSFNKRLKNT